MSQDCFPIALDNLSISCLVPPATRYLFCPFSIFPPTNTLPLFGSLAPRFPLRIIANHVHRPPIHPVDDLHTPSTWVTLPGIPLCGQTRRDTVI